MTERCAGDHHAAVGVPAQDDVAVDLAEHVGHRRLVTGEPDTSPRAGTATR